MTMESDGERLDEVFESPPDETQDWYFDLPQGAWERQEEKNRNLRQTLLNKQAQQQPQRRQESEPKGGEKKRRWFGGGKDEQAPEETTEKPRFSKLSEESREERRARLEALANIAEETTATDEAEDEDVAARPLLRRSRSEDEKSAFDSAPDPDAPVSRWDAMFGSGLQEGSIVDGMRQWATSGKAEEDEHEVAELAADVDDSADDDGDEWNQLARDADESSMLEVLRRRRHAASMDDETAVAEPVGDAANEIELPDQEQGDDMEIAGDNDREPVTVTDEEDGVQLAAEEPNEVTDAGPALAMPPMDDISDDDEVADAVEGVDKTTMSTLQRRPGSSMRMRMSPQPRPRTSPQSRTMKRQSLSRSPRRT